MSDVMCEVSLDQEDNSVDFKVTVYSVKIACFRRCQQHICALFLNTSVHCCPGMVLLLSLLSKYKKIYCDETF